MRIVHAIRSDGFAGVERHVARLARAQTLHGHRVLVIGGDPAAMSRTFAGAQVPHRPARTLLDVVGELRRVAPGADVVHVHMTAAEIAATVAAASTAAFPPIVSTRHFAAGRGSGPLGPIVRGLARSRIAAQIAVSRHVAAHVDGSSVVIHPGVDRAPVDVSERTSRGTQAKTVLMVQRLELEKRGDLGLRAFAASGLAGEGWRLEILGSGGQRPALETLAMELGIVDQVDFRGARNDVEVRMRHAALLIAPCPDEGLGLSVLEAMSAGLPVVAAGAGGHVELLTGLDPAALYPPSDWHRAGAHLAALAADPDRRRRYGRAAKVRQRDQHTPERQVRATDAVYRTVVGPVESAGQDLVVVSLEMWDQVWRRNQYLVTELARANPDLRVLFVEPAADPLHQLSRRQAPRRGRGLRRAEGVSGIGADQLFLYQPTKALPRRVDPRTDDRLANQARRAVARVGMDSPVLWINDPAAARLLTTTEWPVLYDVTDDWLAAPRTPAEHDRLIRDEALLLSRAHAVVVCSEHLAASKGAQRKVELITNAVDVDRYREPRERPDDLPGGPVALYLGTAHPDRFDVDVLLATAIHLAGSAVVVLVGPVVDLSPAQYAAMDRAGIVRLGARPWSKVPAYLQHATVLLVPHLVNDFTDSLDPIKLYEYRAVGRPVVATRVAGFRDSTDPTVVSVPAEDFPAAVRRAVSDGYPGAPARDLPTWQGQAGLMAQVISRVRHTATPR